jgi:nucleotide-binding universal stress UspA family protein
MSERMERIVVGIDGSALSKAALRWALAEAARRAADLEVVHVWSAPTIAFTPYAATAVPVVGAEDVEAAATRAMAQTMAEVESAAAGVDVTTAIERGNAAEVLAAKAKGPAMVVVGSHGHGGFAGMLLGSTSNQLLHHAPAPVVVVNSSSLQPEGRIVVGVDGSAPSIEALRWALAEARLRHTGLDVVHGWQYPGVLFFGETVVIAADDVAEGAAEVLQQTMAAVADEVGDLDVRTFVERGHPVGVLAEHAKDAALLVVGSRGRGGFAGLLLGSVGLHLLHQAECPLLVARPQPSMSKL